MGIGPVFAVPKLLKRAGLSVDDIDLWELNEAFASQVVYCRDTLGIPMDKLNAERRLDRDRPSVRHDRLADGRHDRQRDGAPQGPLRRRDDVRRRRAGRGGAVRERTVTSEPVAGRPKLAQTVRRDKPPRRLALLRTRPSSSCRPAWACPAHSRSRRRCWHSCLMDRARLLSIASRLP